MSLTAKDLKSNCMYEVQRFNFTEHIKVWINADSLITYHYLNNDPDLLHYTTHSDFDEIFTVIHELAPVESNNSQTKYRYLVTSDFTYEPYVSSEMPPVWEGRQVVYDLQLNKYTEDGETWEDIELADD